MFTRWVSVSAGICWGNCGIAALFGHILYERRTIRHTSGPAGQITHCTAHCTRRCRTTPDICSLRAGKRIKNLFSERAHVLIFKRKKQTKAKHIFWADDWWLLTLCQPKETVGVYYPASPSTCWRYSSSCRCDAARSQVSTFCWNSSCVTAACLFISSSWRQTVWSSTKLHMRRSHASFLTSADTNGSVCLYDPQKLKVLFSLALANAFDRVVPLRDDMSRRRAHHSDRPCCLWRYRMCPGSGMCPGSYLNCNRINYIMVQQNVRYIETTWKDRWRELKSNRIKELACVTSSEVVGPPDRFCNWMATTLKFTVNHGPGHVLYPHRSWAKAESYFLSALSWLF